MMEGNKVKKIVILSLCLMMVLSNAVAAKTSGDKLQDLQIIRGDESGNLSEDEPLTRAQLAVILCQLNQVKDEAEQFSESMGFLDVAENQWYAPYVNYCKNKGWLNGASQTTFNPNGFVSEEMITIVLERVLGYDPAWGEATDFAEQLGMHVDVQEDTKVLRGEVFNYMYQSLFVKEKETGIMLYKTLNIDIKKAYNHLLGIGLTEDYEFEYYDINGQIIESDVQRALDVDSDDRMHAEYSDGKTVTYNFRYNDKYIVQENGVELVQSIDRSAFGRKAEKYQVNEMTPEYIILSEMMDGYIINDYLYDWNGQAILLPEGGENHFISPFEDETVIITMMNSKYTKVKNIYLYNIKTQTIQEDIYPYNQIIKIEDHIWLYIYLNDDGIEEYKLVDKTTGNETLFDFKDNTHDADYFLTWKYGNKYGEVTYYTIDKDKNIELKGGALIDLEGKTILETQYYIVEKAFEKSDIYIVTNQNDEYGLMNIEGDLILDVEYAYITQYIDGELWVTKKDGEEFVFTESMETLTFDESAEKETVVYILPNGTKLITYQNYFGPSQIQDMSGNVIKKFDDIFEMVYNPNQNVIIDNMNLFTIEGERLEISDDYDTFSDFDHDFISAVKNNQTYIIDIEGNIILGPYDGDIEFE